MSASTLSYSPINARLPHPPPSLVSSQSDTFLSSRLSGTKRSEKIRRPSHLGASSHTLEIVPEDGALRRPLSASFRSADGSAKGKAREQMRRSESSGSLKRKRTEWILDLVETAKGAQAWGERERVVLITGSPSADALQPLLYNPTFANTLLLVGSVNPLPSIEALTSPSFLLTTSHGRTIYPTLQPFSLKSGSDKELHPLPSIIQQATDLAMAHRKSSSHRPQPRVPSRRDSADSAVSISPPRTPPNLHPTSPGFNDVHIRRSSESSSLELQRPPTIAGLVESSLPKSGSDSSLNKLGRARVSSRNLSNRDSFFGSLSKSKTEKAWAGGSPIDAVINFIPPASDFQTQRAMQDMLHQAVVLTTGIVPMIARRQTKSDQTDSTPVSLLHVLPAQVPGPLPGVVEDFLLGVIPKFASQSDRELLSSVITLPALSAPPRQLDNESYSGIECLLFGGLRCPLSSDPDIKPRAFLPNWTVCISAPGAIGNAKPRRPAAISLNTEPPSIGYDSMRARTPPVMSEKSRSTSYPANPRAVYRGDYPQFLNQAGTPELDSSYSSCSSVSGVGEMNSSTGSDEGHVSNASQEKKKKSLFGWLKTKGKK